MIRMPPALPIPRLSLLVLLQLNSDAAAARLFVMHRGHVAQMAIFGAN